MYGLLPRTRPPSRFTLTLSRPSRSFCIASVLYSIATRVSRCVGSRVVWLLYIVTNLAPLSLSAILVRSGVFLRATVTLARTFSGEDLADSRRMPRPLLRLLNFLRHVRAAACALSRAHTALLNLLSSPSAPPKPCAAVQHASPRPHLAFNPAAAQPLPRPSRTQSPSPFTRREIARGQEDVGLDDRRGRDGRAHPERCVGAWVASSLFFLSGRTLTSEKDRTGRSVAQAGWADDETHHRRVQPSSKMIFRIPRGAPRPFLPTWLLALTHHPVGRTLPPSLTILHEHTDHYSLQTTTRIGLDDAERGDDPLLRGAVRSLFEGGVA